MTRSSIPDGIVGQGVITSVGNKLLTENQELKHENESLKTKNEFFKGLYKESRDYSFAQVLVQEGKTLPAWLTDSKGRRVFSLLKMEDGEVIDGNLENGLEEHVAMRNFADYCDRNDAVFLLPVISNGGFDRISVLECALSDSHREVRDREIKSLNLDLMSVASRLGVSYDSDFFPVDKVFEAIANILEAKDLKLSHAQEIEQRDRTIKDLESRLELANEKYLLSDRQSQINDELRSEFTATFESYQGVLDSLRGLFNLPLKENYLDLVGYVEGLQVALELASQKAIAPKVDLLKFVDHTITELQGIVDVSDRCIVDLNRVINDLEARLQFTRSTASDWEETSETLYGILDKKKNTFAKELSSALDLIQERDRIIQERDRTIAILEDNLDRARSEHLEQLRAIIQMLEPLKGRVYNSTENKDGKIYVHVNCTNEFTHNEKNSAIKLIQKIVYANVKRLDPSIKATPYDDDF